MSQCFMLMAVSFHHYVSGILLDLGPFLLFGSRGYIWDWARDSLKYWQEASPFLSGIFWYSADRRPKRVAINRRWNTVASSLHDYFVFINGTQGEVNDPSLCISTVIRSVNALLSSSWLHCPVGFSSGGVHLKNQAEPSDLYVHPPPTQLHLMILTSSTIR